MDRPSEQFSSITLLCILFLVARELERRFGPLAEELVVKEENPEKECECSSHFLPPKLCHDYRLQWLYDWGRHKLQGFAGTATLKPKDFLLLKRKLPPLSSKQGCPSPRLLEPSPFTFNPTASFFGRRGIEGHVDSPASVLYCPALLLLFSPFCCFYRILLAQPSYLCCLAIWYLGSLVKPDHCLGVVCVKSLKGLKHSSLSLFATKAGACSICDLLHATKLWSQFLSQSDPLCVPAHHDVLGVWNNFVVLFLLLSKKQLLVQNDGGVSLHSSTSCTQSWYSFVWVCVCVCWFHVVCFEIKRCESKNKKLITNPTWEKTL